MSPVLEVPASPAQRRLWAVEQEAGGAALHNIGFELDYDGPLELDRMAAAVADVVARHEALRTDFRLADGVLTQTVRRAPEALPLRFVDLGGDPDPDRGYLREREALSAAPFDLSRAPLLRVAAVRRRGPAGDHDTLIVVVHHLVADAWSAAVLLVDLTAAYRARVAGTAPDWAPVAVQYADFSAWLAGRASSAEAERDLAYWRERLSGLPELDLTHGRPRPRRPASYGDSIPVQLPAPLVRLLNQAAKQHRATPFMLLLAAYSAALGRVFGGTDLGIGTSVGGRPTPEVARTVGLFVDRLVLRMDLRGNPTFAGLVARARDVVTAAYEHASVGFDAVVQAVAPHRVYGVTPLAQASLNLQPLATAGLVAAGGAGLRIVGGGQFGNGTVRHDLNLDLADTGEEISGLLEYRYGVVSEQAAQLVARLFPRILSAGLTDPDRPVAGVPVLEPAELISLHAGQHGGPAPAHRHLLDRVGDWVRDTPDAVAVRAGDATLSYADLARSARRVADRLAAAGVRRGEPVLAAAPRGAALPVAMLGTLAAGAVYVPVDPDAPGEYLALIARAVAARLALTGPDPVPGLPGSVRRLAVDATGGDPAAAGPRGGERAAADVAALDGAAPDGARPWRAELAAPAGAHPAEPAYVLFTSGSTGVPKGVLVEHRNLAAYVAGVTELMRAAPGAVHLMVQAPTFDSSLTHLAGALVTGGVLRIVDVRTARDPQALVAALRDDPADYLKITPSHLLALLAGVGEAGRDALRPRHALILGGEGCRRPVIDELRAAGWSILGHYGPTETTVGVLAYPITDGAGAGAATVALGRPLRGVQVYVLDDALQPVPPGRLGELYVGGALVARGYAGAPGQTAAVFVPDPYAARPGARMYRTGDLVRRLPDGTFEFCGRADRQVKVRGHRLEPAAVEAVLAGLAGVGQAAVVPYGPDGATRLVAYVVPEAGTAPVPAGLRDALAARLPGYAVPAHILLLDALPMTTSGKLDLAGLPDPGDAPAGAGPDDESGSAPATATERALAAVWCSVLGIAAVPASASFFDLGGDSILAVQAVGRAREAGLPLSTQDLFAFPVLRSLAAHLDGLTVGGGPDGARSGGGPDGARSGGEAPVARARLEPAVVEDLRGPAHDAYGTATPDLALAATVLGLASLTPHGAGAEGRWRVLLVEAARPEAARPATTEPAGVVVEVAAAEVGAGAAAPGQVIRAAREAIRTARAEGTVRAAGAAPVTLRVPDPPGGETVAATAHPSGTALVLLAGTEVTVVGPGETGADALAAAVRDALTMLVRHCVARAPQYAPEDFPDAGLDAGALARLLDRVGEQA